MSEYQLQRRGVLLVVSAPSGTGKSVVLKGVFERYPNLEYSVSCTTRPMRPGEVDGESYHFITEDAFKRKVEENAFYEWAEVHGNLYGTLHAPIEKALAEGRDVALDIDIQGGLNVKQHSPDAVLVFLLPPSPEVLEQRLRGRATDSDEAIALRLKNARDETRFWPEYDYVVINRDLEKTIGRVSAIFESERHRCLRVKSIES